MTDKQTIMKNVADMEALANAILHLCQQTRELMEKENVPTSSTDIGLSHIAKDARKNLRSSILNPRKRT